MYSYEDRTRGALLPRRYCLRISTLKALQVTWPISIIRRLTWRSSNSLLMTNTMSDRAITVPSCLVVQ